MDQIFIITIDVSFFNRGQILLLRRGHVDLIENTLWNNYIEDINKEYKKMDAEIFNFVMRTNTRPFQLIFSVKYENCNVCENLKQIISDYFMVGETIDNITDTDSEGKYYLDMKVDNITFEDDDIKEPSEDF